MCTAKSMQTRPTGSGILSTVFILTEAPTKMADKGIRVAVEEVQCRTADAIVRSTEIIPRQFRYLHWHSVLWNTDEHRNKIHTGARFSGITENKIPGKYRTCFRAVGIKNIPTVLFSKTVSITELEEYFLFDAWVPPNLGASPRTSWASQKRTMFPKALAPPILRVRTS